MIGIALITMCKAIGYNEEKGFSFSFLSEDNDDEYLNIQTPFREFRGNSFYT